MADIVSSEVRSRMMSGIRSKNTRPEILIRQGLHGRGLRFRLHCRELPGKPDIVFPKWKAVLFVHGCFWHGHHCHLFRMPATRRDFWEAKIAANAERDRMAMASLAATGWRIGTVWECGLKGKTRRVLSEILSCIEEWLRTGTGNLEISGEMLQWQ